MPKFKGYVQWSQRKHLRTVQAAWSDDSEYEVPVLVIPGNDVREAMDEAVAEFRKSDACRGQSSFGALRWSTGARVESIDYERRILRVSESVRLCD